MYSSFWSISVAGADDIEESIPALHSFILEATGLDQTFPVVVPLTSASSQEEMDDAAVRRVQKKCRPWLKWNWKVFF